MPERTLGGVYVANVTPFKEDGTLAVDEGAYLEHVAWLSEGDVRGVVPFGTNGEGPSVSVEEKLRVLGLGRDVVRGARGDPDEVEGGADRPGAPVVVDKEQRLVRGVLADGVAVAVELEVAVDVAQRYGVAVDVQVQGAVLEAHADVGVLGAADDGVGVHLGAGSRGDSGERERREGAQRERGGRDTHSVSSLGKAGEVARCRLLSAGIGWRNGLHPKGPISVGAWRS